jgi:viroplasmin and RNaseH domain-containing protein
MVFRGRHPGVYSCSRICQVQVNGFFHNSYNWYETREEVEEEFNLFLADETILTTLSTITPKPKVQHAPGNPSTHTLKPKYTYGSSASTLKKFIKNIIMVSSFEDLEARISKMKTLHNLDK